LGILFLILFIIISRRKNGRKNLSLKKKIDDKYLLDQKFYDVEYTYPELNKIYHNLENIKKELNNNLTRGTINNMWEMWPEKELYEVDKEWKIIPFKAFDVIVPKNCEKFPYLWEFISSIPNVRIAIISKLSPGMKLKTHQGWGKHSNNVLRCHFGLNVPVENSCYISVADNVHEPEEIRYHSPDEWLIFDDSKYHYAENPTNLDRIVLIMDIDRPFYIKEGTSKIKDSKELTSIVNSYRNM